MKPPSQNRGVGDHFVSEPVRFKPDKNYISNENYDPNMHCDTNAFIDKLFKQQIDLNAFDSSPYDASELKNKVSNSGIKLGEVIGGGVNNISLLSGRKSDGTLNSLNLNALNEIQDQRL